MPKFKIDFSHHYSVVVEAEDAAAAMEMVDEGEWGEPGPVDMGMDQHPPVQVEESEAVRFK